MIDLSEYKITSSDYQGQDVKALPDVPAEEGYTAAQIKERMDNVPENVIVPKYNHLIDGLNDAFTGTVIEVTLDKDYWGIGSGYYKNAFTPTEQFDEYSILIPLYTESNMAALGNANVTGTYFENRGDKFIALFTGGKPSADFTFYARLIG